MISEEEFLKMLDEIADEIPRKFFQELNNGILLMLEAKLHPASDPWNPLWVLGQYRISPTLGRSIYIYYGSFERLYGDMDIEVLREKVRHTVMHEFQHHLESLAGEHDLDLEDQRRMASYKRGDYFLNGRNRRKNQ